MESSSSVSNKVGFFNYVFKFDDDSKSEILNILQYAFLSLLPIIILNKSMQTYVPEADDKKGSLELSAEIIIQTIVMFLGLLLINRIVTYVPTYSGVDYPEFSIHYIILAILMITLSLQTKLGEKVSILVDRVTELWEGPQSKMKNNGKKGNGNSSGNVKVSQPISGQNMGMSMTMPPNTIPSNQSAMNQSLYGGSTSISQLPSDSSDQSYTQSRQQLPNYNNMYQQDTTPLVGAATPGMPEAFSEPMAANSVLGGGAFGSW
jgi:hypothetical protein